MKNTFVKTLGLISALLLASCGTQEQENLAELQERRGGTDSSSWQNASLVANTLGGANGVRINARTNYITYFENGVAVSKWKVATARAGKETPKGIYSIHQKEVCPPWNNGRGGSAAACASNNPLGKKALWFYSSRTYGMHGVDLGHLGSVTASNPRDRDQSSGCVRNHPSNIEWLYSKVQVGTPVVVGLWDADPAVVDCSGDSTKCGKSSAPVTLLPKKLPSYCAMNVSAGAGRARVRSSASASANIVDELVRDNKVKITQEVNGQEIGGSTKWYAVEYTLGGAKSGFIHSSLVDCTR